MTERPTRAVTREIAIAAPVDTVWKALTDAEELTRWFPRYARVEPGAGGRLWRAWQSGDEVEERIERWEPNAHLRTVGLTGGWKGIATDYYLTTRSGTTVLRVVSSGFGSDADWDALYDAFGGGWDFELRGLRHYLEHHAGVPRLIALARGSRASTANESWRRILAPGGWMGRRGLTELIQGARYSARLASGLHLSGIVHLWQPTHQFAATVDDLNNAYLRVDTRCIGEMGTPWIWLSTYGVDAQTVHDIERDWQASLDAAFGGSMKSMGSDSIEFSMESNPIGGTNPDNLTHS
jgi:uncharacterized protein YndB with AHSA1/START domain